jgi:hypothetical protein
MRLQTMAGSQSGKKWHEAYLKTSGVGPETMLDYRK